MGMVGCKRAQERILPTTQSSQTQPTLHQALLISPGPGLGEGRRASWRWRLAWL